MEAKVGSGKKRRFGPGDVLLAEDTKGEGHCTKSLDGAGRWSIFIALGEPGPFGWLWARPTVRECVLLVLLLLTSALLIAERRPKRKVNGYANGHTNGHVNGSK